MSERGEIFLIFKLEFSGTVNCVWLRFRLDFLVLPHHLVDSNLLLIGCTTNLAWSVELYIRYLFYERTLTQKLKAGSNETMD